MSDHSDGGLDNIPLSVPVLAGNEWAYLKDCLDTGFVSSVGSYVERFEKMVCDYTGASFAVACVNGTSALHISLLLAGVLPGDEVVVPTITFIATVNVVRYCGAEPVFMDCDPNTLGVDLAKLEDFLETHTEQRDDGCYNLVTGRRIAAVVPVHVFGQPVAMDVLLELGRKFALAVVEDAAEALGSTFQGKQAGTFGLLGCYSFNGNKIITCGGGGMIVTDDFSLAARGRHLTTQAKVVGNEYDHDCVGYNYRLTNIQAALGVAQLERLDSVLAAKRGIAKLYQERLADVHGVHFVRETGPIRSNNWLVAVTVAPEKRAVVLEGMAARGIQVRGLWKPIHTLPMFRDALAFRIETAPKIYSSLLNLPSSANLRESDVLRVCEALEACLEA